MPRQRFAGVLCLDKPPAVTSRDVVNVIAGLARANRVGHAGTLDPLATGVLVVCVGWATRLVPLIQQFSKRYRAEFELGLSSDTDDRTGLITRLSDGPWPERQQLEQLLPRYCGRIMQVPPQFSAVHTGGKRAYDLARRGETVELAPRPVDVHYLELIDWQPPRFTLDIECGSGTYIRSLGRDMGRDLNCGAVLQALDRTAVGPFVRSRAVTLDGLHRDNWLQSVLSPLSVVEHLPRRCISSSEGGLLHLGRRFPAGEDSISRSPNTGELVALVTSQSDLVALGEFLPESSEIQPRHVFPEPLGQLLERD
jgi:tRNA pseudouridine55 synthase